MKLMNVSKEFWFINIMGWVFYNLVDSFSVSLYSGSLYSNFIYFLPTAIVGMFFGFYIRFYYLKLSWCKQHPIVLLPVACVISILFGIFCALLYFLNHTLPNSCVPFGFLSLFSCAELAGTFLHSEYAMLVWVMLYYFIEAERKAKEISRFNRWQLVSAVTAVLIIKEVGFFIEVITNENNKGNDYLFSAEYFISNIIQVFCNIIFSLSILLVRPREQLFNSRLIPLLPTIFILMFCSSALSVWTIEVVLRISNLLTYQYLPEDGQATLYLLFGSQTATASSDVFAGTLRSAFRDNVVLAIFILYCRYSSHWQARLNNDTLSFDAKKIFQFWSYNLGGWFIAGVCLYISGIIALHKISSELDIAFTISFVVIGVFMGVILRSVIRHYRLVNSSLLVFAYKVAIIAILLGLLQTFALWFCNYIYIYVALTGVEFKLYESYIRHDNFFYLCILICGMCCFLWALIYEVSVSQREKLEFVLKQLQLEKNMKETQLNALAGKIDPHFIFNALNNIRSLINEDAGRAREAILVLSDILRSPISKSSQDKVTVAEEMVLVRNYIALSKIQLENRLIYNEKVSADIHSALIPSMMLQILVENAIKHGISQLPDGGSLSLHLFLNGKNLIAELKNSGALSIDASTRGFGVGVKNIQERLRLLYGDEAIFNLQEEQSGVVARLILPLEYLL